MPHTDLTGSLLDSVLDACTLYERRQVSEDVLLVSLERNARLMEAFESDTARVLRSFASVIEAIVRDRPPERRYVDVCGINDRIRELVRFRRAPVTQS